jgi:hypothetical protein
MSEILYIINESGNPSRCTQEQYDELIISRPKIRIVEAEEWNALVNDRNAIAEQLYGAEPVVAETPEEVKEEVKAEVKPKVKKTKKEITEEHQTEQSFPQLNDLTGLTNEELIAMLKEIDPETEMTVESIKADIIETILILREDAKSN